MIPIDAFSLILTKAEDYVKNYMNEFKDSSHDWYHVGRVRKIALTLARETNEKKMAPRIIDEQVVELTALLHDVGDFKFLKEGEDNNQILSQVMNILGLPSTIQEPIKWIHPRISFRHELQHPEEQDGPWSWELGCVQDADRLEAIGSIGIARCFAYNGARNLPLYEPFIKPQLQLTGEYYNGLVSKGTGNARNHFYEKLVKIAGLMKTIPGKREAARRHQMLVDFITEFDRECDLETPSLL